jgi:hypothetical protein
LASIPTTDDLRSDPLAHRFGDFFNPPGLTNFQGCVQSEIDLTGIRNLNFPPFATGRALTLAFVLDGRHFQSLGSPVATTWYPDKIVREANWKGIGLKSTTILIPDTMVALVVVNLTNHSGRSGSWDVGFNLANQVGRDDLWDSWLPEIDVDCRVETGTDFIVATSRDGSASCLHLVHPEPDLVRPIGFRYHVSLAPGESRRIVVGVMLADGTTPDLESCRHLVHSADEQLTRNETLWNRELAALFTPSNDRYSGHLPLLHTENRDIQKLYWMGAVGLAYFKRDSPYSAVGRAYDTLMPRYWLTLQCIWDYFLSSPAHVLLDPGVMRSSLERWMNIDLHQRFGTEYLKGSAIGPWYAVNDYAMASMIYRYASWTGDLDWLHRSVTGRPVHEQCAAYATAWRSLRSESGLAAFGDEYNLLECVGSYVHEVAAFNAGHVAALRMAAEILDHVERRDTADELRAEADELLASLRSLYVEGRGYWHARMPDGSLREVRHALDLLTAWNAIDADLTDSQRAEMTTFFRDELMTPRWMRALSAADEDVLFSIRPDHQWTGAYGAWPSETAKGLFRIGQAELASSWMEGLAQSANQGPFAQAHMADGVMGLEAGGAAKSSYEMPYINDWHSSSSGSWVSLIIEGLFGVRSGMDGPSAKPQLTFVDPNAELSNLMIHGRSFAVDRNGLRHDG